MANENKADVYARHDALYDRVPTPDHVPADRVVDFDYLHPPGIDEGDVYTAWHRLHDGPEIVWTPCNGGHWIVTRGEDVKFVQENYEIFSHEVFTIPRGSSAIHMPPLTVDPPLHARYRAILNPFFTPGRVKQLQEPIEQLTRGLIAKLKPGGGCEFVNEFARIMPVSIFLGIVDLPIDNREQFVDWAVTYMTSSNASEKLGAQEKVVRYLQQVLNERYENPGGDLLSRISGWRDNSRFQGDYEVLGMAVLVYFGGLDTVANMLSFITRHLAEHPEQRQRLVADPSLIPQATEEFLRRFGLSNTGRLITRDFEYKGVQLKKDEMIMVPISMSSMDDRLYTCPMHVDLDRNPVHNTFGNGPHKCVGNQLARAEIQIFLREWLSAIPDFRIDPHKPAITHSGSVNGVSQLHLVWNV